MKASVRSSIYLLAIAIVALVGAASLYLSEHLAKRTVKFRATQKTHLEEISAVSGWDISAIPSKNGVVGFLVANKFFKTRTTEPEPVKELKKLLTLPQDLFFPDVWLLLSYMSHMEQRAELHRALTESLKRGFLKEARDCGAGSCDDSVAQATVGESNAALFIDLLTRNYMDRALTAYRKVSLSEGFQGISDIHSLTQFFSIAPNSNEGFRYSRILVLSAFLGRYDNSNFQQFRNSDFEALESFINDRTDEAPKVNDTAIRSYMSALQKLRSGCFLDASLAFEQQIGKSNYPPLVELNSFMSMRSLARPFVDLSKLKLGPESAPTLAVLDCEREQTSKKYLARYDELEAKLSKNIRRRGLAADVKYYRSQMPFAKPREQAIMEFVVQRGKENGSEVDPAPSSAAETGDAAADKPNSETPEPPKTIEDTLAAEANQPPAVRNRRLPTFRWPVRGRVIAQFGAKTNDKSNDGINIAVPEGTPVRAAAAGTVVYSGNEFKAYGNLVLMRHSSGYVTAYAHLQSLLVARNQEIAAGHTIGLSGQTGEVGSPQLHFEIRKGSSPVDPLAFMEGG